MSLMRSLVACRRGAERTALRASRSGRRTTQRQCLRGQCPSRPAIPVGRMALSLEIPEELLQVVIFGPDIRCVEPGKALRLDDALFCDVIVEGLGPPELPV